MRLKVHQLRIALIAVNLVLAGSAALYAFSRYKNLTEKRPSVPIVPAHALIPKPDEVTPESGARRLTGVAGPFQPTPPPIDIGTGPDTPDDGTPEEPLPPDVDHMLPGPLGDHWEYVFFILRDDPRENLVTLGKKDANAQSPSTSGGAAGKAAVRPRPTIRPQRTNLSGQRKAGPVQAPGDRMTFVVKSRKGKDETTDPPVEFMIHSADAKRFVYWMPDDPKKMYALERVTDSPYADAPEEGLRPRPKPEGETAEDAKPKKHFIPRPDDWESGVEKEYTDMLEGKPAGANMKLIGPQEVSPEDAEKGKDTDKEKKGGTSSKKPVPSFGSGKPGQPRMTMSDEEKEQLREVFKSPKMTAKDRAELEKAFMGGKKK